MNKEKEMVTLDDAVEQGQKIAARLALLHLGFSKVLIEELGQEMAEKLIIKSIIKYGKLINTLQKQDNLPAYGLYDKQSYNDKEYIDMRKPPLKKGEKFDFTNIKIYGCVLAKTFKKMGEEELGRLYCYIDAAKSMAENIDTKLIHTDCALCNDDYCSFKVIPTSEIEKENFKNSNKAWKAVDPMLDG